MARINVPPLTRGLLVFVLGLFLVYQAVWHASHTHTIPWIVISPVNSVTYPWVYVSATLTEENPITLLIAAATFFYGGRYLERAWSARDLAIFLLIVSLIPNVLTSLVLLVSASTRTSWSFVSLSNITFPPLLMRRLLLTARRDTAKPPSKVASPCRPASSSPSNSWCPSTR